MASFPEEGCTCPGPYTKDTSCPVHPPTIRPATPEEVAQVERALGMTLDDWLEL